ncbi:MAG: DDE-type integrase/transposase/recombinase [Pseudomonadota bacterium]
MQDTSNMLTRWAIALQSYDFTVQHKPGKLNIIPDTLSRLFTFERQQDDEVKPLLAPICRNVPENPEPHTEKPHQPFQFSADKLDNLKPVQSDRELFTVKSIYNSATNVFMSVDKVKLQAEQMKEYGPYIRYLTEDDAPIPEKETLASMSYYSIQDDILYRSYLPGHLRKRGTFRDQLVLPEALRGFVLHSCHDHALSGGHLGFKPTYEKIRQRYWWPTVSRDVRNWCRDCQACQRRKTAHNRPKIPTGHIPVERPFQRVSIDLVEYKTISQSSAGVPCKYVMSVMDHLTRYALFVPIPNKSAVTVAQALIDRVLSTFGIPEKLHSDRGKEFENKVIYQLQTLLHFDKTRTSAFRPQGNSVSERVHSTLHAMLAMHSSVNQDNWASMLPYLQMAYNTSFNTTVHETPYFLLFGRQPRLPVDIILGIPDEGYAADIEEYTKQQRDNLQLAYELARRNLQERADKQKASNDKLKSFPTFEPGEEVLLYRPYQDADGPNPKLLSPWRGPYTICSRLSPLIYKVKLGNDTKQTSVHLAHLKKYYPREKAPAPNFEKLAEFFLGKRLPLPEVDRPDVAQPKIERYIVDKVVGHKRGPGRKSHLNYKYRLRLKGYGPSADLEYRADEVPQCQHLIDAYRIEHNLNCASPQDPPSLNTRKRKRVNEPDPAETKFPNRKKRSRNVHLQEKQMKKNSAKGRRV